MALLSMVSHRLRTFLTMLGIIIGIASVVSVVALGEGRFSSEIEPDELIAFAISDGQ